jgi:hypothetical protein
MPNVQIEIHHGLAAVTRMDPGLEVEIVDVDAKEVVVYDCHGDAISVHVLTDEEIARHG